VVLAFFASLGVASSADARGSAPWFGTYQVSVVGGSQDASWTLNHVPTSECDAPSSGHGTDEQTFLPGGAQTVQFNGVGSTAFPSTISGLELRYDEDREGSITEGQPAAANPASCSLASGGEGSPPPTPDCGTRNLSTQIDVDLSSAAPRLGESPAASVANEPHYKDCPVFGQSVPAFATPLVAALPPLGPTNVGGLPSGRATLEATEPIGEADVAGQTTLKLELQFLRVLVVDAMGMPADVNLSVDGQGDATVPIECPSGTCSGTVALELGGFASGSSVIRAHGAAAQPRFPAPASVAEPTIASARFQLKAHHRGVRVRLPGGRRFAKSIASTLLDVVVSEGSGKRRVRYVAGDAHLRA
jgi:hypothetical protein